MLAAFRAAVTSPTVVKAEKNVAVFVLVRVLQAAGASAGVVVAVEALVKHL